jgi:hypothetical protein
MGRGATADEVARLCLNYTDPGELAWRIDKAIGNGFDLPEGVSYYGSTEGDEIFFSGKFYDISDVMLGVSSQFPTLLFLVHGDGEEGGDVWEQKFKDGRTSGRVTAQMTYNFPDGWQ